jgi:ABC-2 type transport system permease protein
MSLLAAEVRRFWSRRAIAVVLLLTAVVVALLAASAVWSTRPLTSAERLDAQAQVEQMGDSWRADLERCQEVPEDFFGPGGSAADCEDLQPRPEDFVGRAPLDLDAERGARGLGLVFVLVGAAVVMAATFTGADWSSGALGTQLVFEPRRLRVWGAKALAVVLSATTSAALLSAAFWVVLWATARARGPGVPDDVVAGVLTQSGRALVLVAAAALGAHALTMLLRSTVGTLGLLFGYVVAGEIVVASLPFDKMSQWSLANNVQAWISDGIQVYDESICPGGGFEGGCDPVYVLGGTHGLVYLAVLLAVVLLLSPPAFLRRDVS